MELETQAIKGQLRQALLSGRTQQLILRNSLDTIIVRAMVRRIAEVVGYSPAGQAQLSAAVFQVARDVMAYAGRGKVVVSWRQDDPQHQGLVIFCSDCGLKAPQWTEMLRADSNGTDQNHHFLRRLVDEFQVTNDKYGSGITLVKWLT